MKIGLLKEPDFENRVALTPASAETLKGMNTVILVEKGAGVKSFITDTEYENKGASIKSRHEVISVSDILVMIHPPESGEIDRLKDNQIIAGLLNPLSDQKLVERLTVKNITAFSMELVPRISRAQSMDILSSMATVSGYKAVLDAACNLPVFFPMFMSAAGTIKPAKVLILGGGVAGLQAIAIARKLGAVVEVFDVRSEVKEEVKSLGAKFIEVEGAVEDSSAGGYAVEQTEEFRKKQGDLIHEHAVKSDVIICTAQIPGKPAPALVKKGTVEKMKGGSVIVDLAASTGGNCELTKNAETVIHNNIRIIGNTDYPSQMPLDASSMYSKNMVNFLKLLIDDQGNPVLNFEDEVVKGTCLVHKGEVMNQFVKEILKS